VTLAGLKKSIAIPVPEVIGRKVGSESGSENLHPSREEHKLVHNYVRPMQVMNYSEFRSHLAENMNLVTDHHDTIVVSRSKEKTVVVLSLYEYNSIQETLHLLSSRLSLRRLDEAIEEMNAGRYYKRRLMED